MKLRTSPNTKIIFSILLVIVIVAASVMFVVIPKNKERIDVQNELNTIGREIQQLKNQIPNMDSLIQIRNDLIEQRQTILDEQEHEQTDGRPNVNYGSIDTSVSNMIAVLGGMAEGLEIGVSSMDVMVDTPIQTLYGLTIYGEYQDITTFFQTLSSMDMEYEFQHVFMQSVIVDEETGVPIPAPGAQPINVTIGGGSTEAVPMNSSTDPNVDGRTSDMPNNGEDIPTESTPNSSSSTDEVGNGVHPVNVGEESTIEGDPDQGLITPGRPGFSMTSGYNWAFGDLTDTQTETPLFDLESGNLFETAHEMKIQASFIVQVTKNTNGKPLDVRADKNVTPLDPFSEDRTVNPRGRFGYNFDYMGEGVGSSNFDDKIVRLILDDSFRKDELERTRAVIDNRRNAGLSITSQLSYLSLIVHIDVEVNKGKNVDRTTILQNFGIVEEPPINEEGNTDANDGENESPTVEQPEVPPTTSPGVPIIGSCTNPTIKGNDSSSGDKIYHTPTSQYYDDTIPEVMFCTTEDAINAGYKAPLH